MQTTDEASDTRVEDLTSHLVEAVKCEDARGTICRKRQCGHVGGALSVSKNAPLTVRCICTP